jgi:hypothetical protein
MRGGAALRSAAAGCTRVTRSWMVSARGSLAMDPPFLAEGPLQRHGQDGQDFGRDANLLVGD